MTERRSLWIPWLFVGAFMVVLVANGTLTYFALSSWSGLETTGSYKRGSAYNSVVAAEEMQRRLGWSLEARFTGDAARGELSVDLRDDRGRPLAGGQLAARFVRPTHEGYDIDVTLQEVRPGGYRALVALPLAGQWDVRLVAQRGEDRFFRTVRLFAPVAGK